MKENIGMARYILDIVFILTLLGLAFVRREGKLQYIFWILLVVNVGIRIFLIIEGHRKALKINLMEKKQNEIEKKVNIIHSFEIHLSLEELTDQAPLTNKEITAGVQNVVAFFTHDKTRIRFVTDFQFAVQQISSNIKRASFIYKPEDPTQILGKSIDYLNQFDKFCYNFSDFTKFLRFNKNNMNHVLSFSIILNGIEIIKIPDITMKDGQLYSGQLVIDVKESFTDIENVYKQKIDEQG